ncbi:hypothetical protein [Paraburkholderia hospita]|uniref:hypothetical protein n=1 Tax=Paraburkholderia hospita TaxID=169430 RepID=UPI001FC8E2F3|nr:hypothetical protein [Paraburkholderia hospita]
MAFLLYGPSMSETLDLPVALAAAPFDPAGKTVDEVVTHVERTLRRTENEPEWVSQANIVNDANTDLYGLLGDAPWPEDSSTRRVSLSIERGNSEGWIIRVDLIELVDTRYRKCRGLMRIKTLSRSHAWSVAAIVSRMLDLD